MLELNKCYNMDCVLGMKEFPDGYFDLAVVDPPYGGAGNEFKRADESRFGGRFDKYKNDTKVARTGGKWAAKFGKEIVGWDNAPDQSYFDELFRVSKNQIIWGGNYFALPPNRCFLCGERRTFQTSSPWRCANMRGAVSMTTQKCLITQAQGFKGGFTQRRNPLLCTIGFLRTMRAKATRSLTRT